MNSCVFTTTRVKTVKFDFIPPTAINSHIGNNNNSSSILHDIKNNNEHVKKHSPLMVNDKKRPSKIF